MAGWCYRADWAVVDVDGAPTPTPNVHIEVDDDGTIAAVGAAPGGDTLVEDLGPTLLLPGLVDAHSHAFQRLLRGRTGRRSASDPSSFWTWRRAMYEQAGRLDPDAFEAATTKCFTEMIAAGITCVGEFHYLHHAPDGTPYADRNEMSLRVIRAAARAGIRLCLLEVFYERGGPARGPEPEQRRFCDGTVERYLDRLEDLRARVSGSDVSVGIAPHSVRAVSAASLRVLVDHARRHDLVVHAHVSEQPRENEECRHEHGRSPVQLLADLGALDRPGSFTAVHAIHVDDEDRRRLAGQTVCACPTTEADLGDGIVAAAPMLADGVHLALGSDANAVVDLVQEARLLEMHERLRTFGRLALADAQGAVAPVLLRAATRGGAAALGRPAQGALSVGLPFDAVAVDLRHELLRDVPPPLALDALFLSGSAAPIQAVYVGGRRRK